MRPGNRFFFAAAIVIATVSIGIYAVLRSQKVKHPAGDDKPHLEARRSREEAAIARGSFERRAVNEFANALREVFEWRKTQRPTSPASRTTMVKTLAEKFQALPTAELPQDFADSWAAVLKAWQALAQAQPPSPELVQAGKQASERMNKLLSASGYGDLRL